MQIFRHVGFSATKVDAPYEVECNVITDENISQNKMKRPNILTKTNLFK